MTMPGAQTWMDGTKPGHDETCDATLEHMLQRKALQHLSLATIDDRRRFLDLAVPGNPLHVMPGLRPGHPRLRRGAKTWMAGTKPGHDETCDATPEHILWRKALQHFRRRARA